MSLRMSVLALLLMYVQYFFLKQQTFESLNQCTHDQEHPPSHGHSELMTKGAHKELCQPSEPIKLPDALWLPIWQLPAASKPTATKSSGCHFQRTPCNWPLSGDKARRHYAWISTISKYLKTSHPNSHTLLLQAAHASWHWP